MNEEKIRDIKEKIGRERAKKVETDKEGER